MFVVNRRSLATALFACIAVFFTACLEDQDGIIPVPADDTARDIEKSMDPKLPKAAAVDFRNTSESAVIAQLNAVAAAIDDFDEDPESFSDFLIKLRESGYGDFPDSGSAKPEVFSLFERGYRNRFNESRSLVERRAEEIDKIATSSASPEARYASLQNVKRQIEREAIQKKGRLTSEEYSALLYEISFHGVLLKAIHADRPFPKGSNLNKDVDILYVIIYIAKTFGIDILDATLIQEGTDRCALAIFSVAWSTLSCAAQNYVSCVLLPWKVHKAFKKCKKDPIPYCTLNPSPCCGVVCIQNYNCNYRTGECEYSPQPCIESNCRPGEGCYDGRCRPH